MDDSQSKDIVAIIFIAQLAGLLVGTLASGPLHGFSIFEFFGALLFAPLVMTMGVPFTFDFASNVTGFLVVFGFFATIMCSCWAYLNPRVIWLRYGVFVGALLWSIGNIPTFTTMMSV